MTRRKPKSALEKHAEAFDQALKCVEAMPVLSDNPEHLQIYIELFFRGYRAGEEAASKNNPTEKTQ